MLWLGLSWYHGMTVQNCNIKTYNGINSRWDDYRRATLASWLHLSFIVVVIIVVDVSISHRRQFLKIWLFNSSLTTLQLKFMKHMQQVLHLLKEIWMNIINLNNKPDPRIDYIFNIVCWYIVTWLLDYFLRKCWLLIPTSIIHWLFLLVGVGKKEGKHPLLLYHQS